VWCDGEEYCNEGIDACDHQNAPDCPDDGLWCDGAEYCNEDPDACDHQNAPDCPDNGLWCDGTEYCNEDIDACDHQDAPDCPDDEVFCNGMEFCDEDNDQCGHQNPPSCDDGIACSVDSCDAGLDECVYDTDDCTAVLYPNCPVTIEVDQFDVPVALSATDGEDAIGFSLIFDDLALAYQGYTVTGTVLELWTVVCEPAVGLTDQVDCLATSDTPLLAATEVELAVFTFTVLSGGESMTSEYPGDNIMVTFETTELTEDLVYFAGETCDSEIITGDDDDDDATPVDDDDDDDDDDATPVDDDDATPVDDDDDNDNDDDDDDDEAVDDDDNALNDDDDDAGPADSGSGDDDDDSCGC